MISPESWLDKQISPARKDSTSASNKPQAGYFLSLTQRRRERNAQKAATQILRLLAFSAKVTLLLVKCNYFCRDRAGDCRVALTEEMAAPTHTRKPEQAATQSSSRAQGVPPSTDATLRHAYLSLRLWTASDVAGLTPSNWESENPAVCLTLDFITASEGAVVALQGGDLVAAFPSLPSAIQAARRLQWAFQGFSEGEITQAASLAILIYFPEEVPGQTDSGNVVHLLEQIEQATPGKILLTEKASQPFERLPGFVLQAASGDGLRELLWRGPESQSNRSFDEEILTQLIEQQGSQTHPSELPDDQNADLSATAGTANQDKLPSPPVQGKSRWLIGGLLLAALVLVTAAVLYLFREKLNLVPAQLNPAPVQTQAPSQTPTAAQSPIASPPVAQGTPSSPAETANPSNPVSTETPAPAKAAKNKQKGAIKPSETQATETTQTPLPLKAVEPPPAQHGKCDLEPSQYSGQIDQAERNLARGKYADAERQFSAVLACDPGNGRAKEGLERARMAARESE
jgi:hypothetical protein